MKLKRVMETLKSKPLVYAVVLLIAAIGAAYAVDQVAMRIGVERMRAQNDMYLHDSLEKSGSAFVSLSAIKAGVAVIEGSTVGVEAGVTGDLQVGDATQSLLDFLDMAWKVTFFSSAILFLVRTLLLHISMLGPPVMLAAFVSGAILLSVRNWKAKGHVLSVCRRVFWFFLLCVVGVYIALPVSVSAARWLSEAITRPVVDEGLVLFEEIQKETTSEQVNERLFPEGETLKARMDFKSKLGELVAWCRSLFSQLCRKGICFCAGLLFDCLIFPGAVLVTVWCVLKRGLAGRRGRESGNTTACL